MAEKIKIKPEWDNITRISTEAINAGTTYGKLQGQRYGAYLDAIARQERLKQEIRERQERKQKQPAVCLNCGGTIPSDSGTDPFCCRECGAEWARREQRVKAMEAVREGSTEKPPENQRLCPYCGKPVDGRSKYCNEYCRYMFNRERERRRKRDAEMKKWEQEQKKPNLFCQNCGKPITASRRNKYCGPACARYVKILQKRQRYAQLKQRIPKEEIEV